jgi:hypothetical protein
MGSGRDRRGIGRAWGEGGCVDEGLATRVLCGLAALTILSSSIDALADVENVVSVNPLALINGEISVQYERVFISHFSLAFGVAFYDAAIDPFASDLNGATVVGPSFTLQPRFYFIQEAPRGLYVSPFVRLDYLAASNVSDGAGDSLSGSGVGYAVGGIVGWSWLFGNVFNLKGGLGLQYENAQLSIQGSNACGPVTVSVGGSGIAPAAELQLGLAF